MTTTSGSSFVNIGERTNVTGSATFRKLIEAGDDTAALTVARSEVEAGTEVTDINMVGRCGGSTPQHIALVGAHVMKHVPRKLPTIAPKMRLLRLKAFVAA